MSNDTAASENADLCREQSATHQPPSNCRSRDAFGRGDAFCHQDHGASRSAPLQRIREFRNRPNPGVAVTVDLLSTGVTFPTLSTSCFAAGRGRILFGDVGRGTRKGGEYATGSFHGVRLFDGTLLSISELDGITKEEPVQPTRTIHELIDDIWSNRPRLQHQFGEAPHRIDKSMSAEARVLRSLIPDGDVARYARTLPAGTGGLFKRWHCP
jgi:type I restriction enzyme R subunit